MGNLQDWSCITIKLEYFLGGIISDRELAMNGPSALSNELDMDQRRSNGWQDLLLRLLLHWIILMDWKERSAFLPSWHPMWRSLPQRGTSLLAWGKGKGESSVHLWGIDAMWESPHAHPHLRPSTYWLNESVHCTWTLLASHQRCFQHHQRTSWMAYSDSVLQQGNHQSNPVCQPSKALHNRHGVVSCTLGPVWKSHGYCLSSRTRIWRVVNLQRGGKCSATILPLHCNFWWASAYVMKFWCCLLCHG